VASLMEDQASGLRRIFALASRQSGPLAISFVGGVLGQGGGDALIGRNTIVAELARALATQGKEVLIIDENHGPDSVASAFGLTTRFDLMQAVNCDVPAHQVVLQAEPAIRIVPAARVARESARLDAMQQRAVSEWLRRLQKNVDVVLIDSAMKSNGFSFLHPSSSRVVVVAAENSVAIKSAYGHIKRLAKQEPTRSFDVVVACMSTLQEGEIVFENINQVAQEYLGLALSFLGCISLRRDANFFSTGYQTVAEALLHAGGSVRRDFSQRFGLGQHEKNEKNLVSHSRVSRSEGVDRLASHLQATHLQTVLADPVL